MEKGIDEMNETELKIGVSDVIKRQRKFFATGATKDVGFRREMLLALKASILKHERELYDAFWKDLHKSEYEAYLTEVSIVLGEIDNHLKHVAGWVRPERVMSPMSLFFSKCRVMSEPLGVALIVSPWNYPFQLLLNPLVGAISSGCCAVLKNSDYVPHIAMVIDAIVRDCFKDDYVAIFDGGREVNAALLAERFDFIFFTGSPKLGKVVMTAAANYLTPVVLELGGKSPCVVDQDADVDVAARRIVWGKMMNAGQTCIAVDYLFVHEQIKDRLVDRLVFYIEKFYGADAKLSPDFGRIVNRGAFDRLVSYLKDGRVLYGGKTDADGLFISPTLMDEVGVSSDLMENEIFGPILPIFTFSELAEVERFIRGREKPLAFYFFTNDRNNAKRMLCNISAGGACINDTLVQVGNDRMPFGGVGNSGMGSYHGKYSFDAFSHKKSVVFSSVKIDLPLRYAPFEGKLKWLKRFV